jgi:hypothetical protein
LKNGRILVGFQKLRKPQHTKGAYFPSILPSTLPEWGSGALELRPNVSLTSIPSSTKLSRRVAHLSHRGSSISRAEMGHCHPYRTHPRGVANTAFPSGRVTFRVRTRMPIRCPPPSRAMAYFWMIFPTEPSLISAPPLVNPTVRGFVHRSLGSASETAARTTAVVTQYRPETPFSRQNESK